MINRCSGACTSPQPGFSQFVPVNTVDLTPFRTHGSRKLDRNIHQSGLKMCILWLVNDGGGKDECGAGVSKSAGSQCIILHCIDF